MERMVTDMIRDASTAALRAREPPHVPSPLRGRGQPQRRKMKRPGEGDSEPPHPSEFAVRLLMPSPTEGRGHSDEPHLAVMPQSIRNDAAAADIDAVGFPGAVELALRAQDRDLGADFQLAARADRVSEEARAGRNDDALLAVLVLDRDHLPVDAGDRLGDGGVGHRAFRRAVPRPEALAEAALALGEDGDADGALAAVGIGRRADADEGAGLDLGERRAADA